MDVVAFVWATLGTLCVWVVVSIVGATFGGPEE